MAVVPLPLPATIKLQYATNMNLINSTKEFIRLKERCLELGTHLEDRIVVHDIATAKDLRLNGADLKQKIKPSAPVNPPSSNHRYYAQGYQPSDEYDEIEQIYDYVRGFAPLPKTARGWRYEPSSPTKLLTPSTDDSAGSSHHTSDLTPPEPPPLETLPSRMKPQDMSVIFTPPPWAYGPIKNDIYEVVPPTNNKPAEAKKRQRHSAEKSSPGKQNLHPADGVENFAQNSLSTSSNPTATTTPRFIKSANYRSSQSSSVNYRQRFFRSTRSPIPVNGKEAYTPSGINPSVGANHGPSMFHMRYKSMTNLANPNMGGEYDTLNSSNSGGKTSGGSSSNRHPETKRSRKLSRPKSMTNLFWGHKERSASRQSLNAPELTLDPMISSATNTMKGTGPTNFRPHSRDFSSPAHHAAVFANGKKLGSSKKIGTLYL